MTDKESELIERLMQGDLDTKAERYMRSVMSGNKGDVFTRSDLYEYIIEAYKQGYRDAKELVCYNKRCCQRLPAEEEDEISDFEAAITAEKNRALKRFGME